VYVVAASKRRWWCCVCWSCGTEYSSSAWILSPCTRHINTQFSTNNCTNILYFNVILNTYLKVNILHICKLNYSDVLCNISLKEHLPEDGHNMWPKHVGDYATCYGINVYVYIYALVGRISHKESSV